MMQPLEGSYPCWVIEEDPKAEAAHSMLEAARKLHAAAQKAAMHESTRVTRDDSPLPDTKSTEGTNIANASAGVEKPEEAGQEVKPGEAGKAGGKEASAELQDEVTHGEQLCANCGAYIGGFKVQQQIPPMFALLFTVPCNSFCRCATWLSCAELFPLS